MSAAVHPFMHDSETIRRSHQTKLLMEQVVEWADYYPELVSGDPKLDLKAKDILRAIKGVKAKFSGKKRRPAPPEVVEVRHYQNEH